jgi:SpoVK/Ycf46/Vps4 family AAA+-type ATPase
MQLGLEATYNLIIYMDLQPKATWPVSLLDFDHPKHILLVVGPPGCGKVITLLYASRLSLMSLVLI